MIKSTWGQQDFPDGGRRGRERKREAETRIAQGVLKAMATSARNCGRPGASCSARSYHRQDSLGSPGAQLSVRSISALGSSETVLYKEQTRTALTDGEE